MSYSLLILSLNEIKHKCNEINQLKYNLLSLSYLFNSY